MAFKPTIIPSPGLKTFCRRNKVRLLVAFGSRVTGSPPPASESDLDLALLTKFGCTEQTGNELSTRIPDYFPSYDVDIIFLHEADPLLRYEVMRRSILLFGNPDTYVAYQVFSQRDLMDSRPLLELEERLHEKKMAYLRSRLSEPGRMEQGI